MKQNIENLEKINKEASSILLEIKGLLHAIQISSCIDYPSDTLLELSLKKLKKVFYIIEENRKILNIDYE